MKLRPESTFYCTLAFVRIDITLSIELSTMVTMAVLICSRLITSNDQRQEAVLVWIFKIHPSCSICRVYFYL